jgi:hypothetical protein
METTVSRAIYPCPAVILSVQRYLADFHVELSEAGPELMRVRIEPKRRDTPPLTVEAYLNHLQQSAFRYQQQQDTRELRRILLEKALAPYGPRAP